MLGLKRRQSNPSYSVMGWNNCISSLNYDCDIVFLGDSLTYNRNFQKDFPKHKICNLGCPSDTIKMVSDRLPSLFSLSPQKIFIMCGINGMSKYAINNELDDYVQMLKSIKKTLCNSQIFVLSVLPVSKNKVTFFKDNKTIELFNSKLKQLCTDLDISYIDLYNNYLQNGFLGSGFTFDGLHLNQDSYSYWLDSISFYINGDK